MIERDFDVPFVADLAVWNLRRHWEATATTAARLAAVEEWTKAFGGPDAVMEGLGPRYTHAESQQHWQLAEVSPPDGPRPEEIAF